MCPSPNFSAFHRFQFESFAEEVTSQSAARDQRTPAHGAPFANARAATAPSGPSAYSDKPLNTAARVLLDDPLFGSGRSSHGGAPGDDPLFSTARSSHGRAGTQPEVNVSEGFAQQQARRQSQERELERQEQHREYLERQRHLWADDEDVPYGEAVGGFDHSNGLGNGGAAADEDNASFSESDSTYNALISGMLASEKEQQRAANIEARNDTFGDTGAIQSEADKVGDARGPLGSQQVPISPQQVPISPQQGRDRLGGTGKGAAGVSNDEGSAWISMGDLTFANSPQKRPTNGMGGRGMMHETPLRVMGAGAGRASMSANELTFSMTPAKPIGARRDSSEGGRAGQLAHAFKAASSAESETSGGDHGEQQRVAPIIEEEAARETESRWAQPNSHSHQEWALRSGTSPSFGLSGRSQGQEDGQESLDHSLDEQNCLNHSLSREDEQLEEQQHGRSAGARKSGIDWERLLSPCKAAPGKNAKSGPGKNAEDVWEEW